MSKLTVVSTSALLLTTAISAQADWPASKGSKVSADLLAMEPDRGTSSRSSFTDSGYVVIDAAASSDPEALAEDLHALGASKVAVFGRMVSGILPVKAIPSLNALSSLHLARSAPSIAMSGPVTSQGDIAMRSDVARTAFGVDGTGVMVGTMSDSYDCGGAAEAGIATGDIPSGTVVIQDAGGFACIEGYLADEGLAMIGVIHDVAAGARHVFHTARVGQAGFAQGILALADAGAQVINDDLLYYAEPMFQDGVIAQAIDQVKARGVSYFSSVGNDARAAYESPFRPSGQFV